MLSKINILFLLVYSCVFSTKSLLSSSFETVCRTEDFQRHKCWPKDCSFSNCLNTEKLCPKVSERRAGGGRLSKTLRLRDLQGIREKAYRKIKNSLKRSEERKERKRNIIFIIEWVEKEEWEKLIVKEDELFSHISPLLVSSSHHLFIIINI